MICVTIGCGSHKRMITEHIKLAEDGVRLAELRLDFLRKVPDLGRLLPNRPTAVVVTCRRRADGGMWQLDEQSRQRVLREAIAEGVEYVDLELDTARAIPRYGKTKRIISYHNFEETPADLDAVLNDLLGADPDIVKLVTTPQRIADVFRMARFLTQANAASAERAAQTGKKRIPVVGFCMGEMGVPTRILAKKFGVPLAYATFSPKRILAPGMLHYKTLRDQYRFEEINPQTEVYGVVADPVGHSLSPLIHNASFIANGLNKVYVPFRVSPDDIGEFIDRADELGVRGLSVTIPHKVAVIEKLTQLDPAVEEINACNTIVLKGKKRFGYNTDYLASGLCIETALGGKRKSDDASPVAGRSALVMGAGGAGMAIAYGLNARGARVTLTDGDDAKAERLAAQCGYEFCPWEMRHSYVVQILVNATPIGMYPNVNECPIPRDSLRGGMLVFDAVYNPEKTFLLRQAYEKGCTVVSGIEMFIGQACLQYKIFTGHKASAALIRELLHNALARSRD
ncbi:MAG: shikimate dehydrogenase [Thermoguttaceae bacterium]|nr:shikimate dehydrogenase [Thermoguttaceae bacterium]